MEELLKKKGTTHRKSRPNQNAKTERELIVDATREVFYTQERHFGLKYLIMWYLEAKL